MFSLLGKSSKLGTFDDTGGYHNEKRGWSFRSAAVHVSNPFFFRELATVVCGFRLEEAQVVPYSQCTWDFFLSHKQSNAQDAVLNLRMALSHLVLTLDPMWGSWLCKPTHGRNDLFCCHENNLYDIWCTIHNQEKNRYTSWWIHDDEPSTHCGMWLGISHNGALLWLIQGGGRRVKFTFVGCFRAEWWRSKSSFPDQRSWRGAFLRNGCWVLHPFPAFWSLGKPRCVPTGKPLRWSDTLFHLLAGHWTGCGVLGHTWCFPGSD